MESDPLLFRDLTFIFVAAVLGGLAARRLHLPMILGYVVGGIAISPFTPGPQLSEIHTFESLAEIGVALLMFSIGVEFSIDDLMRVKAVALGGGTLGISLSLLLAVGMSRLAGWTITQGLVIGAAVSVASTMVLSRLLVERGAMGTTHGRVKIGITLFEDFAVVIMTVLLPLFAGSEQGVLAKAAWTLGKSIILLVPLVFVSLKVIPGLIRRANRTNDGEVTMLVAVAICLSAASLAHAVGFSVALGAFVAGLSISGMKDLHSAHSQIIPIRDAFVALFFVSLGTLIQPKILMQHLPLLWQMLFLIIVGKFVIWLIVVKLFRYSTPVAISTAAGLTQIGELSFVVIRTAREANMVGEEVFIATLAASLISIFLNVFITKAAFAWAEKKIPETNLSPA
jgi:CPA2 family monovalent cation:H+ antiporter-2